MNEVAKQRKTICEQIQQLLPQEEGITVKEVQKFLYIPLQESGKLEELLTTPDRAIKDEIINNILKSPYAENLHEARIRESERRDKFKIHNPTSRRGRDFEVLTQPGEKIRVAFWFMDKCGGPEEASKALEAAIIAIKKFERK